MGEVIIYKTRESVAKKRHEVVRNILSHIAADWEAAKGIEAKIRKYREPDGFDSFLDFMQVVEATGRCIRRWRPVLDIETTDIAHLVYVNARCYNPNMEQFAKIYLEQLSDKIGLRVEMQKVGYS